MYCVCRAAVLLHQMHFFCIESLQTFKRVPLGLHFCFVLVCFPQLLSESNLYIWHIFWQISLACCCVVLFPTNIFCTGSSAETAFLTRSEMSISSNLEITVVPRLFNFPISFRMCAFEDSHFSIGFRWHDRVFLVGVFLQLVVIPLAFSFFTLAWVWNYFSSLVCGLSFLIFSTLVFAFGLTLQEVVPFFSEGQM